MVKEASGDHAASGDLVIGKTKGFTAISAGDSRINSQARMLAQFAPYEGGEFVAIAFPRYARNK